MKKNHAGFSLVEMLVVVGILGIVAAGTSAHLLSQVRSQQKMGSKANLIQTSDMIANAFSSSTSGGLTCEQILKLPANQTFSPTGENNVELEFGANEIYRAGSSVAGMSSFTINRLYLADKISLAPQRPNTFLTSLYVVGDIGPKDNIARSKPRNIATIVVKLNANNTIAECNASSPTETAQETCNGMYGMTFNGTKCVQALSLDNNYNLTSCPIGTRSISGVCLPTPSSCANGQVAKGFDLGITQGCAEPPLNPAVGVPTLGVPAPVQGQPDQIPQRAIANVDPLVPVTSGSIPPTTVATTPPPECAIDGATMDPYNYSLCMLDLDCQERITSVTSTTCAVTEPAAYNPPPANATVPSNAPPSDGSCQCSTARIANGQYCSYCSRNVNIGYAYVDYAYAVNQCINGNLVPVSGAAFDPYDECAGGYAPTKYNGTNYRQYGGYDLR